MPRVSVLMPVYNTCAEYLRSAIESVLNQTFNDFEFIIINDGSTDNCSSIIQEYVEKDTRIKFINNENNQGLIAVLNQGLDLCTGEYIARMDSDDVSCSERFAIQVAYMDKHPECGVLGTAIQNFGVSQQTVYYKSTIKYIDLIYKCPVAHPSVFLRKSIMEKYNLRYNPENFAAEDYGLWCDFIRYAEIHNLPSVLLNYRVHSSSVSAVHSTRQHQTTEKLRQKLIFFITDNQKLQKQIYKIAMRCRLYDFANLSTHMLLYHPFYFMKLRRNLKRLKND